MLLLAGVGAAVLGWPRATPASAFGWIAFEAVLLAAGLPFLAGSVGSRSLSTRGTLLTAAAWMGLVSVGSIARGAPAAGVAAAQSVLAAFAAAQLAGFGLLRTAAISRRVAETTLAVGGLAAIFAPLWISPVLELPGAGAVRGRLIDLALGASPLSGVASALDHDWLRHGETYVLSVIGPYYPFAYPSVGESVATGGLAAVALLAMAIAVRVLSRRRRHRASAR